MTGRLRTALLTRRPRAEHPLEERLEGPAFGVSYELVRQRDDHGAFARHDLTRDQHHDALDAALAVGDLALARYHSARMREADRAADAAIVQAAVRGTNAHGHAQVIAGAVELELTGKCRSDVDLDGLEMFDVVEVAR